MYEWNHLFVTRLAALVAPPSWRRICTRKQAQLLALAPPLSTHNRSPVIAERSMPVFLFHPARLLRRMPATQSRNLSSIFPRQCLQSKGLLGCVSRRFAQKPKARDTPLGMTVLIGSSPWTIFFLFTPTTTSLFSPRSKDSPRILGLRSQAPHRPEAANLRQLNLFRRGTIHRARRHPWRIVRHPPRANGPGSPCIQSRRPHVKWV